MIPFLIVSKSSNCSAKRALQNALFRKKQYQDLTLASFESSFIMKIESIFSSREVKIALSSFNPIC